MEQIYFVEDEKNTHFSLKMNEKKDQTLTAKPATNQNSNDCLLQLTLVHPEGLTAGVAVLCEHAVEAPQTVGSPVPHDVALSSELEVALETGKVLHVPCAALGLSALVREDHLGDERRHG